ncbi:MAG TPA: hypothetical protein VF174_04650 [Micromonosporaceae bacterium]
MVIRSGALLIIAAFCGLLSVPGAVVIAAVPPSTPPAVEPVQRAAGLSAVHATPTSDPTTEPEHSARPHTERTPKRPPDLARSLIFSGVLGLTISITGLVMVCRRRRMW